MSPIPIISIYFSQKIIYIYRKIVIWDFSEKKISLFWKKKKKIMQHNNLSFVRYFLSTKTGGKKLILNLNQTMIFMPFYYLYK